MKRVGVLLSGCGVYDGAEIHEAVLTLLAIDRAGAEAVCLAPDAPQLKVVNHLSSEEAPEARNVLAESARIARGAIRDLAQVTAHDLDAIVLPGGYGAALNLSDVGAKGAAGTVHPEVGRILREMLEQRKPIGALCIAPATVARALQDLGVGARLTIGRDRATAELIESMGHRHADCAVDAVVVDEDHKIVTSPAYMLARRISEVAAGAEALVREVLRRA
jgi:enhancing lycopene biosynthesis protein 2